MIPMLILKVVTIVKIVSWYLKVMKMILMMMNMIRIMMKLILKKMKLLKIALHAFLRKMEHVVELDITCYVTITSINLNS